MVRPDDNSAQQPADPISGADADVESAAATSAARDPSLSSHEVPRARGVVDRWLSALVVWTLDTTVKTLSIIFWYSVFAPIFAQLEK